MPDHRTRLRAVDSLLDRVLGKPRQTQQVIGGDGPPIRISEEAFADPEVREAMHEMVRRVGAARATGRRGAEDAECADAAHDVLRQLGKYPPPKD